MPPSRTRPVKTALGVLLFTGCAGSGEPSPAAGEATGNPLGGAFYHSPQEGLLYYWQFTQEPFDRDRVADLIRTLETSEDELERRVAAGRLGECCFGSSFRGMRFSWPSREEREAMISAVQQGRTGARAKVLVPVLMKALGDSSRDVRTAVACSFVHIGPVAAQAAPSLRAALADDDAFVRLWVARALHGITLEVDAPLHAAVAALADPEPKMREMGVYNLELMGQDARSVLGQLQRLAESDHPNPYVRKPGRRLTRLAGADATRGNGQAPADAPASCGRDLPLRGGLDNRAQLIHRRPDQLRGLLR